MNRAGILQLLPRLELPQLRETSQSAPTFALQRKGGHEKNNGEGPFPLYLISPEGLNVVIKSPSMLLHEFLNIVIKNKINP